ncbi:MAG: hypothetical protein HUK23_02290, partial [Sphaerochaetaceae bacterium]|nr:hypothetical protein [Sphaerochaetaceae bacterium]
MKTTKLVLLTVLLMLVLYCGAVIFVTKPDSFAYEAFFSGLQSKVEILTEEQKMIAQQEAREGISAEIQAVSSAAAEEAVTTAVNTAVSTSAQQTQSAIDAALNDYEAVVKA